jgi:hypothetical protein
MTKKFEEKIQENTAATAFQLVWGAIKSLGLSIADQEAVQKGMQKFAKNFLDRHGSVKILGMSEPVPLRDIYTAAQVVSPRFLRSFRTVEDLQEMFLLRSRSAFSSVENESPVLSSSSPPFADADTLRGLPHWNGLDDFFLSSSRKIGLQAELRKLSAVDDLSLTEMFLRQNMLLQPRRGFFLSDHKEAKRPGLELANEVQFLNILGAPGAGKSTFLCRLGLEALLFRRNWGDSLRVSLGLKAGFVDEEISAYEHECLPVLIELRRFRTDEIDILQLIQNELAICGLPESAKLAESLLKAGRLLILLDGIDEVPRGKLDTLISHLRDFTDRYAENRFVTSCRTAFYKDYFPRFTDVVLADFDNAQIATFVRNWFRSSEDRQLGTAEAFLQLLDDPANAAAKELASTPLLLTFLCIAYDDRQRLPANRSALYRQALEILLEKWAASKRVHNEPIYRELHSELETQMLSNIAAPAFGDNSYFFSRREIMYRIAEFLKNELNAPKHLDSNQILEAIEVQQGLIVQRAQDVYSFSHLTLQEYLTAVWYVDNQRLEDLIDKHLFDLRWREVFILVAGLVGKADDFLSKMQLAVERYLTHDVQVVQLLKWADGVSLPVEDVSASACRRAMALSLALERSYVNVTAIKLARSLDDSQAQVVVHAVNQIVDLHVSLDRAHGHTLARSLEHAVGAFRQYVSEGCLPFVAALDSSKCFSGLWSEATEQLKALLVSPTSQSSPAEIKASLQRPREILADAIKLPPELHRLRKGVKRMLESYLNACQLIVDCKNATASVGRSTWYGICHRLIRPPSQE